MVFVHVCRPLWSREPLPTGLTFKGLSKRCDRCHVDLPSKSLPGSRACIFTISVHHGFAIQCAAMSAPRSLLLFPRSSWSAIPSQQSDRDSRQYPGATSGARRCCPQMPVRPFLKGKRRLAPRRLRPARAFSAVRLTTNTLVSPIASADKVCSSANSSPKISPTK